VDALVEAVTRRATDGIAKQQLEPHPHRAGWLLRDDDVAGRLVGGGEREHGGSCDVVVDGPRLTWDELATHSNHTKVGASASCSKIRATTCGRTQT
jgi:hypothetical protein